MSSVMCSNTSTHNTKSYCSSSDKLVAEPCTNVKFVHPPRWAALREDSAITGSNSIPVKVQSGWWRASQNSATPLPEPISNTFASEGTRKHWTKFNTWALRTRVWASGDPNSRKKQRFKNRGLSTPLWLSKSHIIPESDTCILAHL